MLSTMCGTFLANILSKALASILSGRKTANEAVWLRLLLLGDLDVVTGKWFRVEHKLGIGRLGRWSRILPCLHCRFVFSIRSVYFRQIFRCVKREVENILIIVQE